MVNTNAISTDSPLINKRHTLAHILLMAVKELYPNALPTIGPVTDTGFYYDIDFGQDKITPENLKKLEEVMKGIISPKF